MRIARMLAAVVTVVMVASGCGSDDGAGVRNLDAEGTVTGSASGTHTGSASGTHTGSAAASGAFGGYEPVSDVTSHANVALDVCAINELLPSDAPIDFDAVAEVYREGGASVSGDGSFRTLAGFATTTRDEPIWNDYVAHFGDDTWLDTFVSAALEGSGPFEGEPDAVRRQGVQKGVQSQILIAWTLHELVAAGEKLADGNTDPAEGAPHNVDEAWAFYHGADPGCAPYATANSRGENFGTGTAVTEAVLAQMQAAQQAALDGDAAALEAATDEIVRQILITYIQASIRYATQMSAALADGDTEAARVQQAEGWAFFRVIEPLVAQADADAAATVAGVFDLAAPPADGAEETVRGALESVYEALEISPEEIGQLQG